MRAAAFARRPLFALPRRVAALKNHDRGVTGFLRTRRLAQPFGVTEKPQVGQPQNR